MYYGILSDCSSLSLDFIRCNVGKLFDVACLSFCRKPQCVAAFGLFVLKAKCSLGLM